MVVANTNSILTDGFSSHSCVKSLVKVVREGDAANAKASQKENYGNIIV